MDKATEKVADTLLGLSTPEESIYDSHFGVELNGYQRTLIDQYKHGKVSHPGINYNRATVKQRMLEAILVTPYPMNETNGITLLQRLEYMDNGLAVSQTICCHPFNPPAKAAMLLATGNAHHTEHL